MKLIRACLFLLTALAPMAGFAQTVPAGTVTLLNGEAQALGASGGSQNLAKGDTVYEGDTLQTGASSYLLVRFTDQGTVLLRPNSRFQVERYHYNGAATPPAATAPAAAPAPAAATAPTAAGSEAAFFRLLKGGLRAVSGLIAHGNYSNYRMSAPVATMGIRGTDYVMVTCESGCQTDPTVLQAVPQGANLNGAVVVGVNDGQVVVTSFTGNSLELGAGQYAITLADGSQYLLNAAPAFIGDETAAAASAPAAAGGIAAGNTSTASSVAAGTLVGGVVAAGAAAIIGVVVSGSGSNGASTSTSTSTATSTSTVP